MLTTINKILSTCDFKKTQIPPTELYNEGWLLRLVMKWFYTNKDNSHELSFCDGKARWYW